MYTWIRTCTTAICWSLSISSLIFVNAAAAMEPVRFGSVAMDTPAAMHKRLTPLTNYLTESLNRSVILTLSPDMPSAIGNVAKGEVDFAYLTPVAYIKSKAKGDTRLVVKTLTDGQGAFKLMVVVKDSSNINSMEDLAGRSFAFGDRAALLQRAVVVGAGMPLERLGTYDFLGHYDNVVRGVMHGDFDAGIVKDTTAYKWEPKGIRVLHQSPPLPPYNITASAKVDAETFEQMRQALLRLDPSRPMHRAILDSLDKSYDGFSPTNDDEYAIVRQLIEPFDNLK